MTIMELENKLKTIYDKYGDIPVVIYGEHKVTNLFCNESDGDVPGLPEGTSFVELN